MEAQTEHPSNIRLTQNSESCLPDHLVRATRQFVKQFNELERFNMAHQHVHQALRYREPRFDIINSLEPRFYKRIYFLQTSAAWEIMMIFLSFLHMYIIVLENTSFDSLYHILSPAIYCIYLLDFAMQTYHESQDFVAKKARFATFFFLKILFLILLGVDEIFLTVSLTSAGGRPIHPFRIFRVAMPVVYNRELRRLFEALGSAWKNIAICFIFYFTIVCFCAVLMKQIISVPDDVELDEYTNNYRRLDRMIFLTYILGTYDSYPDNQLSAIKQNSWYYGMFILYIFLNMFIFSSIPGSLIFQSFKQTRGKKQVIDQTKMQNSLIVAFITLGEDNYQMDIKKMIKFLLHFYQHRVRFVDTITDLMLKLNTNDHSSIHINDFMQLGRILQQNSNLRPPLFSDNPYWISFRKYMNSTFNLKNIFDSTSYKLVFAVLIIVSFTIATFCLFTNDLAYAIMDRFFINFFFFEMILNIIAVGPETYFNKLFASTDFFLVIVGFIFQFVALEYQQDSLFRMVRIYKASFILDTLLSNRFWTISSSIYENIQNLLLRTTVIIPILLKFLPLFAIIYYVCGVLSMEVLYQSSQQPASSTYSMYDQFSNFNTFLGTQLVMFQVLTEAGWSMIAFDHSSRTGYYGPVMFMFASFHVVITLILATLMKGMIWSAFMAVSKQYEVNKQEKNAEQEQMEKNIRKHKQLDDIEALMVKLDTLKLDTVVKREIYEAKINSEMMAKLRRINNKKKLGRRSAKVAHINTFYRHFGVNQMILEEEEENKEKKDNEHFVFEIIQKFTRQKFGDQQNYYDDHEYELKIKRICDELASGKIQEILLSIKPHPLLNKHIENKIETPCRSKNGEGAATFNHTFDMYILLGSHPTWKEQKKLVLKSLLDSKVITKQEIGQLLHKKLGKKHFMLDKDCTIRNTYMQGTNPKLIEKFEAEYFENIYGKAFKEINKVTIEPLIKMEAKVIYGLKNICRYPNMGNTQFFKILAKLENMISNQLLKAGSLFKMVFQLNCDKNLWFSYTMDANDVPHLTFLKNGLWIYNDSLVQNEIYKIKDLFKFNPGFRSGSIVERGELIKKLYETFETLALSLQDKEQFFESNPQYNVYDSYFMYLNVECIRRLIPKELEISKVMIVLLTKEKERTPQEQIPFQVSEIPIEKFESQVRFKFDETQGETFKKLSHLASLPDEQISARQGLPSNYVLNFLQQVNDILRLYCPNLIHYVQDLLNTQFKGN